MSKRALVEECLKELYLKIPRKAKRIKHKRELKKKNFS